MAGQRWTLPRAHIDVHIAHLRSDVHRSHAADAERVLGMKLRDKVAVITGGARHRRGDCSPLRRGRREGGDRRPATRRFRGLAQDLGPAASAVRLDVTDQASIDAM